MYIIIYAFIHIIQVYQGVIPSKENKMQKVVKSLNNLEAEKK